MHITNSNLDVCFITIFIHNVCNYSCSYCADYHNDGSYSWPVDFEPYKNFIDNVKSKNKYVYLEILGGEPTLWPKFQDFVDYVRQDDIFIEYSTNASRTLRYWQQFKEQKSFVFLSWHYEQADDEHFYNVAKIMQDKVSVSVPLMVTPQNYDRARRVFDKLSTLNIEITPKLTRKKISGPDFFNYTEEQVEWIENNYYNKMKDFGIDWEIPRLLIFDGKPKKFMSVLAEGLHNFQGYTCKAGIKKFYVTPDGSLYRCTKMVGGSLGNILNNSYELPKDPIICQKSYCTCKLDAIIEKWI